MSGRDFGRGRGFGDRRGGFDDRDEGRGGFRDRNREGGGGPRPWERRDDDRPARSFGDRPFERADRPDRPGPEPEQERDVRVERYYEEPQRPMREDRPPRFSGPRDGGDRFRRDGGPPIGRNITPATPAPAERPAAPAPTPGSTAATLPAPPSTPRLWTPFHLIESWNDEEKLKGWTPTDQEVQELVEDNIEGDPLVPGRDRRAISVQARNGIVTLVGTVRNRIVKFAAGSDAYWSYGVKEVRNELELKQRGMQPAAEAPAAATVAAAIETPEPATPKRATRRKATADAETEAPPVPAAVEGGVEFEPRPEAEPTDE